MQFLADNLQKFMAAASQTAGDRARHGQHVPAERAAAVLDVDRDKVLKQGVALSDVYRTMQAYMGGLFVNYFNRFGRQWQVYVEAEGDYRNEPGQPRPVLCAQLRRATWCRFRR